MGCPISVAQPLRAVAYVDGGCILEKGSSECEFVSFVSLYNPSAGKNSGRNGNSEAKNTSEGPETNSPNSQTHTAGEGEP